MHHDSRSVTRLVGVEIASSSSMIRETTLEVIWIAPDLVEIFLASPPETRCSDVSLALAARGWETPGRGLGRRSDRGPEVGQYWAERWPSTAEYILVTTVEIQYRQLGLAYRRTTESLQSRTAWIGKARGTPPRRIRGEALARLSGALKIPVWRWTCLGRPGLGVNKSKSESEATADSQVAPRRRALNSIMR